MLEMDELLEMAEMEEFSKPKNEFDIDELNDLITEKKTDIKKTDIKKTDIKQTDIKQTEEKTTEELQFINQYLEILEEKKALSEKLQDLKKTYDDNRLNKSASAKRVIKAYKDAEYKLNNSEDEIKYVNQITEDIIADREVYLRIISLINKD